MPPRVTLKPVTARNWEAVADLELAPKQRDMVASNVYSLAESKFDPAAQPRAVYAGRELVGFLMYDVSRARGKTRKAFIYRFMIDRAHQGRGYGRAALQAAIKEIAKLPGVRTIAISYMAGNRVARQFYASLGFAEVGRDEDGEVIAEMKI